MLLLIVWAKTLYLTKITNKQLFQESDLHGTSIYILLVYCLVVIINSNKLEI